MQATNAAPHGAGRTANPYCAYGAPAVFAPLADEAGVYLPTGPGDAQRMELLNMPGDGSDVWLDVRTVQLYLQISLTSIYKLIHQGEIPAVKLGTKTIPCESRSRRMLASANGDKIRALLDGDVTAHGGDDSAADIALCNHLAFWTAGDAAQMDRIFCSNAAGKN